MIIFFCITYQHGESGVLDFRFSLKEKTPLRFRKTKRVKVHGARQRRTIHLRVASLEIGVIALDFCLRRHVGHLQCR